MPRFNAPFHQVFWLILILVSPVQNLWGGPLRDWIQERQAERSAASVPATASAAAPIEDVPYGADPRQHFDVYGARPNATELAPVIFMVHGGGWRWGDKSASNVVDNKVKRWVPRGFVLISVDYRMLPDTQPLEQAQDVARALAAAQGQAHRWGADRTRFILMGHSAGAHLVTVLNTMPSLVATGTTPWLGTVALDSAAFDVPAIMQSSHLPLYDHAFGKNPSDWQAASPIHQLKQAAPPLLAVCSSRRDEACPQAHRFATKAASVHMSCTVLEKNLSHMDINQQLGKEARYTAEVEAFMKQLDPHVARLLSTTTAP